MDMTEIRNDLVDAGFSQLHRGLARPGSSLRLRVLGQRSFVPFCDPEAFSVMAEVPPLVTESGTSCILT